jgi:hypothetical protein
MNLLLKDEMAKQPTPTERPDILDWDACLESPPPRPEGTIQVRMTYAGRSRPAPISDPDAE